MTSMLDQLRNEYGDQLKRDRSKEFGPEFVRTTDLERQLVNRYGFDAIRLIFEDRNSANYFPLGQLPHDCPWTHLNGLDLRSAIEKIFAPIAADVPTLIETLAERCEHLYAEKSEATWALHYFLNMTLYDERPYYHIYSGGPPNLSPRINPCLAKYDWPIPSDLARLYAVHDGFGPILGTEHICVMAEIMDPICQKQDTYPEGYQFRDLLEFHPDGAGNAQCFYRQDGKFTTVDWDHEVWEISGPQDFFDYIDQRLSELDEE
ncbi:MAG: hypothetical protein HYS18_11485 [Burkholderiales bacterium]|nr:hypothetical protein [Burkholderiales bacterium]